MNLARVRSALCWALMTGCPASLLAADSSPAMLYSKGDAWINGASVPKSSAIFPGDLVQTKSNSIVNINAIGSKVLVLPDSLVKYQGGAIGLEHGSVSVVTSKTMATQAGVVKITPVSSNWTEFEVSDVDGTVQVVAKKGDLAIDDGKQTSTLAQGQQTTRDESQDPDRKKKKKSGAAVAATGSVMNSTAAIGAGIAAVGGVTAWVLVSRGDDPLSPMR